ncbi:DeoR family fructose operon transcriptional repressor [Salirhabdus euzebyi]|uniref:DeoR family fructose operon transcriptional repressor n=1 Tax=Salirhabdus euzebyi TaxID=394506 RepID=A0A841Q875_9BACI|nr:DeoR/GlpR family DNA-binding transcription regulator [Salirhabdus euzebyi]MBB6454585.1 DeoR family fructose operon transcriptional repressor [Salirhabdus euzebyi]
MKYVKNRQKEIVELLNQTEKVLISDLSEQFNVSEMTLRRDLEALAQKGVIKRIRGGAVKVNQGSFELPFEIRYDKNHDVKDRISEIAANMIKDGETVVIDTGTTALAVAEKLKERNNLTIVTSSLRVAWLLADCPNINLIVTGGVVRNGERSLIGELTEDVYDVFFPDTFICGVGGVDITSGFTDFNLDDARVKKKAIQASQRTIVVADNSKIGKTAFAKIAHLEEVDTLITNKIANTDVINQLKKNDLTVVLA